MVKFIHLNIHQTIASKKLAVSSVSLKNNKRRNKMSYRIKMATKCKCAIMEFLQLQNGGDNTYDILDKIHPELKTDNPYYLPDEWYGNVFEAQNVLDYSDSEYIIDDFYVLKSFIESITKEKDTY